MKIKYGTYEFPEPSPKLSETDSSVVVSGVYDHFSVELSIEGLLTGSSIEELNLQKNEMIENLSSSFQDLEIIGEGSHIYQNCEPTSISFEESDISSFLPYSLSFSSFEGDVNSDFFGVSSPVDEWTFAESDGKIISCSHTVSAKGHKVGNNTPLAEAVSFVQGRVGNGLPDPISSSLFSFNANSVFMSSSEEVDSLNGSYSVTEKFMTDADGKLSVTAVGASGVSATCSSSIEYTKDGGISANVKGSLKGDITNSNVSSSDFSQTEALAIFNLFGESSKGSAEGSLYDLAEAQVEAFSYSFFPDENKIDFSFSLKDRDTSLMIGNVLHKYASSVSSSKESGLTTVSVQGSLSYAGSDNPIQEDDPVDSIRFAEVEAAFSTVSPRSVAVEAFSNFKNEVGVFYNLNSSILSETANSESITKSPSDQKISYSYTYDNKPPNEKDLKNLQITTTNKLPLIESTLLQTINGFIEADIGGRAGVYSVSASCQNSGDRIDDLIDTAKSKIKKGYFVSSSSKNIGVKSISYTEGRFYDEGSSNGNI